MGVAASMIFVATKVLWHAFVATKRVFLSRQKYACCDKIMFVVTKTLKTNVCHDKYVFCGTKVLSQNIVATKVCLLKRKFCCDKHLFVMTKVLL